MKTTRKTRRPMGRRFVFKVWLLVWAIRLGLWLLPFRTMRHITAKFAESSQSSVGWPLPQQISWTVITASHRVPQATCLTQALATQILLRRYGHPAALRIGVGRSETGQFQAHAWVESNGGVVIGGQEAELAKKYAAFPSLEEDGQ